VFFSYNLEKVHVPLNYHITLQISIKAIFSQNYLKIRMYSFCPKKDKNWLKFASFAGNYSSSSQRKDVQRFMRLLCCYIHKFFQRCNFLVLGIWQWSYGDSSCKFYGWSKAFAANMVSLDDQCFHCHSNIGCHSGKSNSSLYSLTIPEDYMSPMTRHHGDPDSLYDGNLLLYIGF
jgi:hypothetical protein